MDKQRSSKNDGPDDRTSAQTAKPAESNEVEPNWYRIEYTADGGEIQWIPDEERPGEEYPLILRRGDKQISAMLAEFQEKAWWARHQAWQQKIERGDEVLKNRHQRHIYAGACKSAARVEAKYGRENLVWDDFEFGLLNGRISALAWVFGSEWEISLDY